MKSKILSALFTVLLLSLFCEKIESQNINNIRFEKNDNIILIDIPFDTQNYFVDDDEYLILTPRIESNDQSLDLLQVILLGENVKNSETNDNNKPYGVFTMLTAQNFIYQVNAAYQPWMDNASLSLEKAIYSKNGLRNYEISKVIQDRLLIHNPKEESQVERNNNFSHLLSTNEKYDIRFPKKNSLSILELTGDKISIDNISNKIDSLHRSGNRSVHITIVAGTCIAGIYMDNEELTKRQAMILKSHFIEKHKDIHLSVDTQWISEDWDGLVKLVEQDHIFPYQQEVLNIINNTGIFTGRERKLMLLGGGGAYRYMKVHYFPKLWKTYCIIK